MSAPTKPSVSEQEARRFRGRLDLVLASALLIAIVGMLNYLAYRHYTRWDWTSEGTFTLSEQTRVVLGDLDTDVELYLVMSRGEPMYEDLHELIERYRAESQRLSVHYVDPDRETSEYELLRERFHLESAVVGDGVVAPDVAVVLSAGDRHWEITRDDIATPDFDALRETGETVVDVRSEQALTGAILEVTGTGETSVCVTSGHGEWELDGGGERSLAGLRDELRRENLAVRSITTRGETTIDAECDVVLVIGPTLAFAREEALLLQAYVQGGGNLLVTLDPTLENGEIRPSGLEEVLRELGVRVDRSLALEMDTAHMVPGSPDPLGPYLVTSFAEDHDITTRIAAIADIPIVMAFARSVRPADEGRGTVLLQLSDASFAETDVARLVEDGEPHHDDADVQGPVPLAVAIEVERTGEAPTEEGEEGAARGRLVVFGDSDFLAPGLVARPEVANFELASATLGWLTQREALIAIPPRRMDAVSMNITVADLAGIAFRVFVLVPLAAIFLGIAVWWNRRS